MYKRHVFIVAQIIHFGVVIVVTVNTRRFRDELVCGPSLGFPSFFGCALSACGSSNVTAHALFKLSTTRFVDDDDLLFFVLVSHERIVVFVAVCHARTSDSIMLSEGFTSEIWVSRFTNTPESVFVELGLVRKSPLAAFQATDKRPFTSVDSIVIFQAALACRIRTPRPRTLSRFGHLIDLGFLIGCEDGSRRRGVVGARRAFAFPSRRLGTFLAPAPKVKEIVPVLDAFLLGLG